MVKAIAYCAFTAMLVGVVAMSSATKQSSRPRPSDGPPPEIIIETVRKGQMRERVPQRVQTQGQMDTVRLFLVVPRSRDDSVNVMRVGECTIRVARPY